jgi:hypothetical protein
MAAKTISLIFDGYWTEEEISEIPKQSGVFVVYECTKGGLEKSFFLEKVIYIGESGNVNERIAKHRKWSLWRKHCDGQQICFSCAHVPNPDRKRSEAALIHKHKPPVNDGYVAKFPFAETTMNLSGKIALLTRSFTVGRGAENQSVQNEI